VMCCFRLCHFFSQNLFYEYFLHSFLIMSICPICHKTYKRHLTLHLLSNPLCKIAYQKRRGAELDLSVPKVVKFTNQSSPSAQPTRRHDSCIVPAHCYDVENLNKIGCTSRRPKRTTIVAHRSASFGGKPTDMRNVFTSDMSTVAMESVTPNLDDYWCRVDEYMESGNINDLYGSLTNIDDTFSIVSDTSSVSMAIADDNDVGVLHNCGRLIARSDSGFDAKIQTIPVHQSIGSIPFTMEERLLIRLATACNEANTPLYLVDVIMDIIQDECEHSESSKRLYFRKRESFMKHLMSRFQVPKAHLLHIGIESLHPNNMVYRREFRDSVSVVFFNFLDQVHDLLNDITIWGDESNFKGTVDMSHPFSNDPIRNNHFVDEIHDAHWYCVTHEECKCISGNEP